MSVLFTYDAYINLIEEIQKSGYTITDYHKCQDIKYPCILRHDIDYSMERAVRFARLEAGLGISSTYFVLVSGDFYNVLSRAVRECLKEILDCGHEIGLHFDETAYGREESKNAGRGGMIRQILYEKELLEQSCGQRVSVVSMHRPSRETLEADLHIPRMINSYSKQFFSEFKYVSDSRMRWREDVERYIREKQYPKMHILTHAFWYSEKTCGIKGVLETFMHEAVQDRYEILDRNLTGLPEILEGQ